ncbi:hypothetical protein K6Y31_06265 [Motilimonas cestriensis]|uniref:Uncharacterized protein n=1 Tax=Motilimonas cestriensis TaxID=2742685 RepID=A0ABS8W605_9GAMM|nr:hypothetical protein [Motilimonas cestriensis]MCE2594414.1 hypothetical protein [Motilimonas cestriensis]
MKFVEQAGNLIAQDPLPDDAPEQLSAIAAQATGLEKTFVNMYFEALMAAATPEQIALWSPKPTAEEIAQWEAELAAKDKA